MQKLVSDARMAFDRGDTDFAAVFDIDGPGVTMKKIRKEIDLSVRAVEAAGWPCIGVRSFLAEIQIGFIRGD
ncbi:MULTISPECIES: hypothetical protein [unclassified Kitasatospora]